MRLKWKPQAIVFTLKFSSNTVLIYFLSFFFQSVLFLFFFFFFSFFWRICPSIGILLESASLYILSDDDVGLNVFGCRADVLGTIYTLSFYGWIYTISCWWWWWCWNGSHYSRSICDFMQSHDDDDHHHHLSSLRQSYLTPVLVLKLSNWIRFWPYLWICPFQRSV